MQFKQLFILSFSNCRDTNLFPKIMPGKSNDYTDFRITNGSWQFTAGGNGLCFCVSDNPYFRGKRAQGFL